MIVILRTSATRQPLHTLGFRVTYSRHCLDDIDGEERRFLFLQVIIPGWSLGVNVAIGKHH